MAHDVAAAHADARKVGKAILQDEHSHHAEHDGAAQRDEQFDGEHRHQSAMA